MGRARKTLWLSMLVLIGALGLALMLRSSPAERLETESVAGAPIEKTGAWLLQADAEPLAPVSKSIEPAMHSAGRPESALHITVQAGSAAEALEQLSREFGLQDYRVRNEIMGLIAFCSADPDPQGALQAARGDSARVWAIEAWSEYCQDFSFDPSSLTIPAHDVPPSFFHLAKEQGEAAAVAEARARLATQDDFFHLHEAAHYLLETGHAPTPASLGVSESRYGYPDQQALMDEAVRLFICDLGGGCGPRSWPLLNYCIVAGCSPDSTLQAAYRENLSPSAYQLMHGYYLWLHRERRGQSRE